ncbi:Phosphorylase kinase, gamma catalytic subunit [Trema orientale]|uniref:non-specific serine/threonine protein kinase n=1 Tax=Trema orientale TaxID=63057 RepID=A0A2P5AVW6_TREOI|nr:Phosphorylase kinase, gamma catalytic subunit [Trema orientale]
MVPGLWIHDNGESLVSAEGRFELGFFTPNGSADGRRYLGIWYHKLTPVTVVWVANRNDPLFNSIDGVFGIGEDGNLHVVDGSTRKSYWSTEIETSCSPNRTVKLMDSGNLVLIEGNQSGKSLWESFKHPTDTFLPGMEMDANLILTSWRDKDAPGTGDFTFYLLDGQERESHFVIMKKSTPYWQSGGKFFGSDKMPDTIVYMLSKFKVTTYNPNPKFQISPPRNVDYNDSRLVINFDGEIQYQTWIKYKNKWDVVWLEPSDRCSISNFCGNFGSCNPSNTLVCKCLPGFKPSFPEKWTSGDFSSGCIRETKICEKEETFLSVNIMKVGEPESTWHQANNETECKKECLDKCTCQAYLFEAAENSTRRGDSSATTSSCFTWLGELHDLQEHLVGGHNLSVRVAVSDLESTVRSCDPCGTTMIPYPLSTGPDCGDPMYFSFFCGTTDLLTFKAPSGEYQVVSIDPDTRKFVIKVQHLDHCDARNSSSKNLQLNQSLPFKVTTWCYVGSGNFGSQFSSGGTNEVEIGWEIPQEPTCTSDADCKEWPNSTCSNATSDMKKRCLCNANFKWNGMALNCTRNLEISNRQPSEEESHGKNMPLHLIVVPAISGFALLACTFISVIVWRRKMSKKQGNRIPDQRNKALFKQDTQRHIKHLMDSAQFEEEDETGIDVPFFDFESILAATDDFSDANKLGQGGYGPVYKGMFPGGQEIAVKRLSSVSGQGLQEFKNEVVLIAKLQHRNLVKLRGYCIKGEEKILLYEYMPNRSLDAFMFDNTQSLVLDWETRFDIIIGIARGLLYLHQDSRLRIIHRDLKTSNILLDQEMNPKISDFGLARIVGGKQTEANTNRVVGTYGYMSPEYALEGVFSVKSDVFSFGVVLIEIISGKKNTRLIQCEQPLSLLGYAWKLWTENKVMDLLDPTLNESCNEDQFMRCAKVGLLCVQEDPSERPTMSSIITMLDSESAAVPTPQQPAFVLRRGATAAASSSSSSKPQTRPEITVTFDGR